MAAGELAREPLVLMGVAQPITHHLKAALQMMAVSLMAAHLLTRRPLKKPNPRSSCGPILLTPPSGLFELTYREAQATGVSELVIKSLKDQTRGRERTKPMKPGRPAHGQWCWKQTLRKEWQNHTESQTPPVAQSCV